MRTKRKFIFFSTVASCSIFPRLLCCCSPHLLSFLSVLRSSSLLGWFFCVVYPLSGVGNQTRFILRQILPCSCQWVRVISKGLWDTEQGRGLYGGVGGIWRRRWKEKWSWWGPQQRSSVIPAEGVSCCSIRSTCKKKNTSKNRIGWLYTQAKPCVFRLLMWLSTVRMKNIYLGCSWV